jgi:hypothetical protein
MRCTQCGSDVSGAAFCPQCGASVASRSRPATPPIPPPPAAPRPSTRGHDWQPTPSTPSTGDRLAVTGKVVGLTGCLLALIFWVAIPLLVLIVAIAATSSTGLAVVLAMLAGIGGFVYWVWRRTGR